MALRSQTQKIQQGSSPRARTTKDSRQKGKTNQSSRPKQSNRVCCRRAHMAETACPKSSEDAYRGSTLRIKLALLLLLTAISCGPLHASDVAELPPPSKRFAIVIGIS